MTSPTRLAALIALSALAIHPPAQEPAGPPRPPLAVQIGAFLEAHHAHRQFSGTALVADDGKIVYQGAFGLANDDWNISNGLDTKFRVGSITKQFTAMLVLLLVEEGKLELAAPIRRYLPDYPPASGSKVTIHHLLNHTSGIPSYEERTGWQREQHHLSVEEFVARFCSDPLEAEPGAGYRNSNSGYYLLGAIIEAVTGQTYGTVLRERILDPLAMHDTDCEDPHAVIGNRATGYEHVVGQRRMAPWTDMRHLFASRGMYSTVGDLWRWDQALRSRRLLAGELEERMFTPGRGNYGYGWHIDARGMWHGGDIPGFSSMIGRLPSRGQFVILLSNSAFASVPEAVRGIAEITKGNTPETPTARPEWSLAQTILDDGIEAGLATFADLPEVVRKGSVESTLHTLGYRLLEQHRVPDAIRLFEFSTRALPTSYRRFLAGDAWRSSWHSLAAAQLHAGHRQLAIESYRKALEVDPTNTNVQRMLEHLRTAAGASAMWYEVVSQRPGPEVTDATMRRKLEASGQPWKVRDRATGVELVLVMPGEFLMGSPDSEPGRKPDEGPQHRVRLSKAYYLGATEVTQAQWRRLMGPFPSFFAGESRPIDPSFADAQAFLAKANAGNSPGQESLRLPTEAEWEYACRAGTTGPFALESPIDHATMNFNDGDVATAVVVDGRLDVTWVTPPSPACRMTTAPAGSLPPNAWGLHEMHGNLWEWTDDKYSPDSYAGRGPVSVDPLVRAGADDLRTLRGGSWYDNARYCRAAARDAGGTQVRSNRIGFRVARTL